MIYLDHGATSFPKPAGVLQRMSQALRECANPGRGGHAPAEAAARTVFSCRDTAARMFGCQPEQVVFTMNCTHGLNMAIATLVKPGGRVVITGFEHNAVTRPLYHRCARIRVAGHRLFNWSDTLEEFDRALRRGVDAAVFTHASNVFGYVLPVEQMARLCRERGVPFILDAAQSAGVLPVDFPSLGADFVAMPGHKGLLGPAGTGILLCGRLPHPLMLGGTGGDSVSRQMPRYLPDRAEAGTVNVVGIAGLEAGIQTVEALGIDNIRRREQALAASAGQMLQELGLEVFSGEHQLGTVSFRGERDCEEVAQDLAREGIAVRAGLHCAPLAHATAGTLTTGTVRLSFGYDCQESQLKELKRAVMTSFSPDKP